jgi:hypothetical protein
MQHEQKTKLRISTHAAFFVQKETPKEEKLKVVRGEITLTPSDLLAVLLCMSLGSDDDLKAAALRELKGLADDVLVTVCEMPDTHPGILDALARVHITNPQVIGKIATHPNVGRRTLTFITENMMQTVKTSLHESVQNDFDETPIANSLKHEPLLPDELDEIAKENDELKNKYKLAQSLEIKEKIKYALTGDKEWRTILIRDNNKMVSESVMKNPRITEQEILLVAKSSVMNDEIIRIICVNKEWTKNYQIRKALIENHRTPLHYSLRFLSLLTEKDLGFLVKSKNVSSVIVTQARRMLTNKNMGK